MDKYDDIQSQLKAWAGFVSSGYEVPAAGGTMNAAADAIKELVSEVERLKGVLEDGVRMAAAMNMTAGWVDSAKQILGGKS